MEEHLYVLEENINSILKDNDISYICHKTASGAEVIELYSKHKYDIIFMDINMPEISGTEIAGKILEIDPNAIIIYVTSFTEYTTKAFEQFAFQYLIKPIEKTKLTLTLMKAFEKIEKDMLYNNENSFITINKNNKKIKIMNKDILYFEKESNYINIYMINQKTERIRMTFKELMDTIDMSLYLRCHKGFIINKSKIKSISAKEVELFHTGEKVPIGRVYKKEFLNFLVQNEN